MNKNSNSRVHNVRTFFRERWQFVLIVLLSPLAAMTVFDTMSDAPWVASFCTSLLAILTLVGAFGISGTFDRGRAAEPLR